MLNLIKWPVTLFNWLKSFFMVESPDEDNFGGELSAAIENCNVKGEYWDLLKYFDEKQHAKVIIFLNASELSNEQKQIVLTHLRK